ncbi:CDP-diacylglycerol---serine O-phosphatidyltransferase [Sphingobacterium nematocida]|uniref:CDP-diacylglycerol--serine O-phosphatidyltransferase n=1 Tax=Sphingobacterium nematocida TaxID=1513896 RepID=A0A1T5C8T7_9SPHI|nr:CDP-diacylglycerol--serine O-phosphatidyltransferase [Sphingobacterium nematocida]SKB55992.1 CDP-diacylglycerol---serine O-phosphatidyltransferase [Sphingobacterium nematocida]
MKKYIPNTITCLNLFSGCMGVLFVLKGEFNLALYCVLASGIFDFFDGMVARLLHVKSLIGKELDSLADVISFGFLPGTIMYMLLQQATTNEYIPYLGFLITVFSALRLAKFNIDERQTSDFIGVNTPMNTFLIVSLPFLSTQYPVLIENVYFLLGLTLVSSLLLVSELRLFSMKLNSLGWEENKFKYLFLIISFLIILLLKVSAIPIVFVLYILFSLLHFGKNEDA